MGEGLGRGVRAQRGCNRFQYIIHALQDFVVPKPQHTKAFAFQPPTSLRIGFHTLDMLTTVHFHNQCPFETNKIDNVRLNGLLAFELEGQQTTGTQMFP